jgi:hypothetical protein
MSIKGPRGVELLQGEAFVLEPSSAHVTIAANVAGLYQFNPYGERSRFLFLLDLTAAANLVGDTLDVLIDALAPDGATWLNALHFPQCLGNGGAKKYFAILDAANPGTACFDVTADAAVNTVRPALFGASFRTRYTIAGGGAQSFTFSVSAYAISPGVP